MRIRTFREDDIGRVVSIYNEATALDEDFSPCSVATYKEQVCGPEVDLRRDAFVAEEGEIWGYGRVFSSTENMKVGKIYLSGPYVAPSFRNRGAGKALLEAMLSESRERGATHVLESVPEKRQNHGFAERFGFRVVRYFSKMRAELHDVPAVPAPESITVRSFFEGDIPMLLDMRNRGFADHWNFTPVTLAEIEQWTRMSIFDPEGVLLAMSGEECVGFCATSIDEEYLKNTSDRMAYVDAIACVKEHRRRGIASHLLSCAGDYARKRGMVALELDMDSENSNASALYGKMGFRPKKRSIMYRKDL